MPRDDKSGKSKGFAFIKFEDSRSTILAVDNFNGIKLLKRTLRVDHVSKYNMPQKKKDARSEANLGEQEYVTGHAYREKGVLAELVRPRVEGRPIKKGDKVEVRFGGRKIWQPATIVRKNSDGTYDVAKELAANSKSLKKGFDAFARPKTSRKRSSTSRSKRKRKHKRKRRR